jgi:hypothetical protein
MREFAKFLVLAVGLTILWTLIFIHFMIRSVP